MRLVIDQAAQRSFVSSAIFAGPHHLMNDTFHVRRTRRGVLVTADVESKGIEVQALLKDEDAIALAIELILCARAPHKSRKATNPAKNPRIGPQTSGGVFVLKRPANSDSGT